MPQDQNIFPQSCEIRFLAVHSFANVAAALELLARLRSRLSGVLFPESHDQRRRVLGHDGDRPCSSTRQASHVDLSSAKKGSVVRTSQFRRVYDTQGRVTAAPLRDVGQPVVSRLRTSRSQMGPSAGEAADCDDPSLVPTALGMGEHSVA